ncbi:MAG: hypothetical protein WKF58_16525 [Ilumatobacteraceae bacterium]
MGRAAAGGAGRGDGRALVGIGRLGSAMVATPDSFAQEGDLLYLAVAADAVEQLDRSLA